jgi:hypothetical protein
VSVVGPMGSCLNGLLLIDAQGAFEPQYCTAWVPWTEHLALSDATAVLPGRAFAMPSPPTL